MKKADRKPNSPRERFSMKSWIFPMCIAAAYLILWVTVPDRTCHALRAAGRILLQASTPLLLAFFMMFLLNLFVTPAHVTRFMGRKSGTVGILFSSAAGIVSMGPIYAWYPFLASLKEKGASDFHLVNFLSSRAVKPALIPLMVTYFGWRFSLIFSLFGLLSALIAATVVCFLNRLTSR